MAPGALFHKMRFRREPRRSKEGHRRAIRPTGINYMVLIRMQTNRGSDDDVTMMLCYKDECPLLKFLSFFSDPFHCKYV